MSIVPSRAKHYSSSADQADEDASHLRQRRASRSKLVEHLSDATVPTRHGVFEMLVYRDTRTAIEHLAIFPSRDRLSDANGTALLRVHSECLTGEALGSLKCECGPQLDAALAHIADQGGIVIYLRGQEGRGIGLANKIRAYKLQEYGRDTLEANLELGFPADARDYFAAAAILQDLQVHKVRLLSNNPDKMRQLREHGIQVEALVPLVVGIGDNNRAYMVTKRDRMGHRIPDEASVHDPRPQQ